MHRKKNPIHTLPEHLVYLSYRCKEVIVSPKADGLYSYIDIGDNIWVMAEHMEGDYYLVFDTDKYPYRHNNNYLHRLQWLRNIHPVAKKLSGIQNIKTVEEYQRLLRKDSELLKEYLDQEHKKGRYRWYPKYGCIFDVDMKDFLKMIDHDISTLLPYKTDGIILTHALSDREPIGKYKPYHLLTVDLHIKDSVGYDKDGISYQITKTDKCGIWRCYWNSNLSLWEPRDARIDKIYPNKSYLVKQIEDMHRYKWRAIDLIPFTNLVYYDHTKKHLDRKDIEYLNKKKDMFKRDIMHIIDTYPIKNILDIGCGKGKIATIVPSKIDIVGIDIDPYSIYLARSNKNRRWICGDMNKKDFSMKPFTNYLQNDERFDLLVYSHSLYYADFDILMDIINKYTNIGSIIYTSFIDSDGFKEVYFKDNFWLKIEDEKLVYSYPWKLGIGRNNLVASSKLIELMKINGYILENKYIQKIDTICVFKRI